MRRRLLLHLRISLLVLLALAVGAAGLAQSISANQLGALQTSGHVEPKPADARPAVLDTAVAELVREASGPVHLMLEFNGLPATVAYAQAGGSSKNFANANAVSAGQAQVSRNEQEQQTALQTLSGLAPSVQVIFRVQKAYNGIAVVADPQAVGQLLNVPGLKAIHVLPLHQRDNAYAVQLTGAYQAWQGSYGLSGDNISIGIIDTGIDYLHTNMGGPGTALAYTVYTDTTPRAVTAAAGVFPNSKVIGGYDFAGNNYTGSATPPMPDDNPLDCPSTLGGGHGSHVAGIAAGYGVNADGTTYTGTYTTLTPAQLNNMRIGPGTAPKADLYALRVFGCSGSTALTTQAIDWATDPNNDDNFSDHLDIINMSLGSPHGTPDDPSAAATTNASLVGVQVVTSAGNSGDTHYISGSPGSSTWALAVANVHDAVSIMDGFRVNTPTVISGVKAASKSSSYNWASPPITNPVPITRTVYYPATNQYGCSPWTGADAANINNRIVLVDWKKPGDIAFPAGCGSAVRANNATAAGAKGIIMVDTTVYPDTAIAGNASIPAMYTVKSVGDELKSQLTAGAISNVEVTLTNEYANAAKLVVPVANDLVVTSSSRGPRTKDNALKPDIAAPGQTIFSTDAGTGTQGKSIGGTSMAAPHVAGVMAMMHELHPDWSLEEYKALLMNTAVKDLFTDPGQTGTKYSPQRVGPGRLHVPTALETDVVFYNADVDGAVGVSFGAVEVLGTATLTRTIEVANKGTTPASYQIGYEPRSTIPGVSYSFPNGNSVNVPAGGTATFVVQLNANASQMKNSHDPTLAETQITTIGTLPRQWLSEASGILTFTPSHIAGAPLRLSLYANARPASDMTTAQSQLIFPSANSSTNLNLVGQGVNTGASYPYDIKSVVSAMEVATTSGEITLNPPNIPANAKTADLRYVGVTSDAGALGASQPVTQSKIFFGIVTYADWSAPVIENTYRVAIDIDENGTTDRRLTTFAANDGTNTMDVYLTLLTNPPGFTSGTVQDYINSYPSSVLPTAIFNNNVMVLPMLASSLYTNTADTRFNYRVETLSRFFGTGSGIIDQTEWLTYDYANPGLDFTGGITGLPMYNDLPGNSIPVTFDQAAYEANNSKGALLLHHYNTRGDRAQVLEVFPEGALTATPSQTSTSTASSTASGTATTTTTSTTTSTATVTPVASATPCTIEFSDVPSGSTFHPFVKCLACKGVLSGYPDGTFRPGNPITRGQIAKIVSNAAGFNEAVTGQTYSDIPPSSDPSSYYVFVERLSNRNIIGGYPCGGPGEPCDDVSRAFYRPGANATRAQMAKIVSNAAGFTETPTGQTFADVPQPEDESDPSSFYLFVERLAQRGVIGGYPCGGPGEPCDSQDRPYYRPSAQVTRGQAAKIVANTFFPNCQNGASTPMPTNTMVIEGPTQTPPPARP